MKPVKKNNELFEELFVMLFVMLFFIIMPFIPLYSSYSEFNKNNDTKAYSYVFGYFITALLISWFIMIMDMMVQNNPTIHLVSKSAVLIIILLPILLGILQFVKSKKYTPEQKNRNIKITSAYFLSSFGVGIIMIRFLL